MIVKLFQSEGLGTPVIDVTHEWQSVEGGTYYPMNYKKAKEYIEEKKEEGYIEISVGDEISQNPEEAVVGMDLIREDSDNRGSLKHVDSEGLAELECSHWLA